MTGVLDGLTVVDLSQFLPGPALTKMLADQGARVVKVEPPAGDPARRMAPFEAGESFWFRSLNHNKDCVRLDLKSDAGRAELWRLIEAADVLVEGFRPGVMARLGFGWEAARQRNPRLVYCSISAFGQTGGMADHPAHDLGAQALSGHLSVNDGPDGAPVVPGVPAADMAAALTGCAAVLMAVIGQRRDGRGAYIDLSMFDALMPWSVHIAGDAIVNDQPVRSAAQRSLGGAAFYNVYATADGRHVVLCGREEKFARNLLDALGRPDLLPLALAEPGQPQAPLKAFLGDTFRSRTRDEWVAWFHDKDIAFAPVLDLAEAWAQPLTRERELLVEVDGARVIGPPIRIRR